MSATSPEDGTTPHVSVADVNSEEELVFKRLAACEKSQIPISDYAAGKFTFSVEGGFTPATSCFPFANLRLWGPRQFQPEYNKERVRLEFKFEGSPFLSSSSPGPGGVHGTKTKSTTKEPSSRPYLSDAAQQLAQQHGAAVGAFLEAFAERLEQVVAAAHAEQFEAYAVELKKRQRQAASGYFSSDRESVEADRVSKKFDGDRGAFNANRDRQKQNRSTSGANGFLRRLLFGGGSSRDPPPRPWSSRDHMEREGDTELQNVNDEELRCGGDRVVTKRRRRVDGSDLKLSAEDEERKTSSGKSDFVSDKQLLQFHAPSFYEEYECFTSRGCPRLRLLVVDVQEASDNPVLLETV
eukprot:g2326.t1